MEVIDEDVEYILLLIMCKIFNVIDI